MQAELLLTAGLDCVHCLDVADERFALHGLRYNTLCELAWRFRRNGQATAESPGHERRGARLVWWRWIFLTFIGAVIGWITNLVAVRMLFHPRQPLRIPLLGWQIQGLVPKRQADLARSIGETVERDLMSSEVLVSHLIQNGYKEEVVNAVADHIEERLSASLSRFVPRPIASAVKSYVGDFARRETADLVEKMEAKMVEKIQDGLPIAKIVEQKVLDFDLDELERLVVQVASTELRYIEWLGAVLGGVIGFIQALVLHLSGT